jgi:hypothetical protein
MLMALSSEFEEFYGRWMEKANSHDRDDFSDYFDNYFSLFVAFNRLYAEATFILARKGVPKLDQRTSFPDADAAKTYVLKYLGSRYFIEKLERNQETREALETLKGLIGSPHFNIKLNMVNGNIQPERDEELLRKLKSRGFHQRGEAVLDLLYSVRCNMFHGHKGFNAVQVDLLKPLSVVLKETNKILYEKLSRDNSKQLDAPIA